MEPSVVSRALSATTSLASELGLEVDDAIVVQNSNRISVRLVPCGVLARVAAPVRRNHEVAAFELDLAKRLSAADSLVGAPEPRVEPIVYVRDGFAATFWTYYDPLPAGDITPDEYAQALEGLHGEMRHIAVEAPHFTDRVDEAPRSSGTAYGARTSPTPTGNSSRARCAASDASPSTGVRTSSYSTANPTPATS